MGIAFSTSISDIIKGFIGIALIVLVIIFLPKFMDKFEALGNINVPSVSIQLDETTIERIATNVVKVHLAANNKEIKDLIKDLKKEDNAALLAALKGQNAQIKEIADLVASMQSSTDPDPDINVIYGADDDPKRLETFIIYRTDAEGKKFPTGIVYYSPNVKEGPKFSYQEYPLDVHATIVASEEGEEEKRYAAMWVENNFVDGYKGQQFSLDLDPKNIRWAKAEPKEKGWRWNPRLNLGSSFTNSVFYPSLGMSLLSYGRTDRDMDWKFFSFSLGGDSNNFYGDITPVEWNLGNNIPLVENLFVGPSVSYGISTEDNTKKDISYGLKFSVPF